MCLWFYIETISRFYSFAVANTDAIRIGFYIARFSLADFITRCKFIRDTTYLRFYMYVLILTKVFQSISANSIGFYFARTIEYIIFRTA